MRYDYWVVRYVPDSIRGEFVNIGVIAGRESDWSLRRVNSLRRASRLGGSASSTERFLRRIEEGIESQLRIVESLVPTTQHRLVTKGELEDLRVRMNNLVQLSTARPVLATTAEEACDRAFELMVVESDPDVRHRSRTQVVNSLRRAFEIRPGLAEHVERSNRATVGAQQTGIDFALRDGTVRQMSQVWAFDVKDVDRLQTQIQAWNYLLGLLRSNGGELLARSDGPRYKIPRNVDINAVYTPPATSHGDSQLEVATEGWRRLGVSVVPSSESESIVEEAERLLTN